MEQMVEQIRSGRVSSLSIAVMIFVAVLSVAIPLGGCIYLRKKYNCKLKAFLAGALVWLIFASIMENIIHAVVLSSSVGAAIQGNVWLYALYGGFMAALFEETGRYYGLKYVSRGITDNDKNAFMYGLGHGGFEAIYVLGLVMVSNITCAFMINNGTIGTTLDALLEAGDSASGSIEGLLQLVTSTPLYFLWGIVERIAAMAAHIGMSVPVWFAIKEKHFNFYFVAFLMHFSLDFISVIASSYIDNIAVVELIILIISGFVTAIGIMFYKKHSNKETE